MTQKNSRAICVVNFCKACSIALAVIGLASCHLGPPKGMVSLPSVASAGITPAVANLAYATVSKSQKLDLYRPQGTGVFPVVVYVHGGGFKFGSRTMVSAAVVKGLVEAGYAVASIDYRLSGEKPFPGAVQDTFSAMAYLKLHGQSLQIDPKNIAVYGESAGANLTALLGVAYNSPQFRQGLSSGNIDLKPSAVVAQFPPVDFQQIDTMLIAQGCKSDMTHADAGSFESAYIGAELKTASERVRQSNPVSYVTKDAPPFFIQNGDADCMIGAGQAGLLVQALQRAGVSVTYEMISGAGHGGAQFETQQNIQKIVSFLNSQLR